jgi:hypothetical protein
MKLTTNTLYSVIIKLIQDFMPSGNHISISCLCLDIGKCLEFGFEKQDMMNVINKAFSKTTLMKKEGWYERSQSNIRKLPIYIIT